MSLKGQVLLATKNTYKFNEFKRLLPQLNLIFLNDLLDDEEFVEDKVTYLENALSKAQFYAKKYNLITLADDSGLEVESLNYAPGVYSARYSNQGDEKNNLKVLKELKNSSNRKAQFKCFLVLYFPNDNYFYFQGALKGYIAYKVYPGSGFAYDQIFIPENQTKTLSLLGDEYKMMHSHRFKATEALKEFLNENFNHI